VPFELKRKMDTKLEVELLMEEVIGVVKEDTFKKLHVT